MRPTDFINGKIIYDNNGQYFFINREDGQQQMLCELRGWGAIQNLFREGQTINGEKAAKFQDEIGEWIACAINEKLERKTEQLKISSNLLPTPKEIWNAGVNDTIPEILKLLKGDENPQLYVITWLQSLLRCCRKQPVLDALYKTNDNDADAVLTMLREVGAMADGIEKIIQSLEHDDSI